ncbi:unnamed protein product [Blumeria hordei]|uniref:Uncharacterized protein n=2 Tax=Blumeria hordei TaxID=2867405 RepID=A0A383UQY0_BLUHO|nr:hypothetical protein BGHDH14_bgh01713 [Blumeria hordei DH14]SZF02206.1 unnamed protein product [Blumeria hordei]
MATTSSFPALLEHLANTLNSISEHSDLSKIPAAPKDGISLLDAKNELFLSYLQNLVFLITLKIRNSYKETDGISESLEDSVVKKLVELQLYIEKGVRPLENRLKYQIEKVIQAHDDSKRIEDVKHSKIHGKPTQISKQEHSQIESDDDSEDNATSIAPVIQDLQYRPNPTALIPKTSTFVEKSEGGVYKPPRIQATSMPTTTRREKENKKPMKSATIDEFINNEMGTAPISMPSVGSTILGGGRTINSDKQRNEEKERREYEERNYVRLPKESKKERAKKGGKREAGYGGEEWRGLEDGIDRIESLTKKKSGDRMSILEKSRKRSKTNEETRVHADIGEHYRKKLKTLDSGRRDRGRK